MAKLFCIYLQNLAGWSRNRFWLYYSVNLIFLDFRMQAVVQKPKNANKYDIYVCVALKRAPMSRDSEPLSRSLPRSNGQMVK